MRAPPEHPNLQAVGCGGDHAGTSAHRPGRPDHDMLTEDDIGFRETGQQPFIDHGPRAGSCFLGRLKHRHQRAFPRISCFSHESGRADQPRHVHVVPACVHDGDRLASSVGCRLCAGIGRPAVRGPETRPCPRGASLSALRHFAGGRRHRSHRSHRSLRIRHRAADRPRHAQCVSPARRARDAREGRCRHCFSSGRRSWIRAVSLLKDVAIRCCLHAKDRERRPSRLKPRLHESLRTHAHASNKGAWCAQYLLDRCHAEVLRLSGACGSVSHQVLVRRSVKFTSLSLRFLGARRARRRHAERPRRCVAGRERVRESLIDSALLSSCVCRTDASFLRVVLMRVGRSLHVVLTLARSIVSPSAAVG